MASTTLTTAQVAGALKTVRKHFSSTNLDTTDTGNEGANLTASKVMITDGSGKIATSAITSTQLGYLSGLIGNVQVALNGKLTIPDNAVLPGNLNDNYETGDLDTEDEIITAINATNATINGIISILDAALASVET
jgi:hypothetical protein